MQLAGVCWVIRILSSLEWDESLPASDLWVQMHRTNRCCILPLLRVKETVFKNLIKDSVTWAWQWIWIWMVNDFNEFFRTDGTSIEVDGGKWRNWEPAWLKDIWDSQYYILVQCCKPWTSHVDLLEIQLCSFHQDSRMDTKWMMSSPSLISAPNNPKFFAHSLQGGWLPICARSWVVLSSLC